MNEEIRNLIKAGKTPEGIRAIAGSSLSPEYSVKMVVFNDVKLQALEVYRIIVLADKDQYNNYNNTQLCKLTQAIEFVLYAELA